MKRENKDSKFVIYQVLYIFVITVLALKGADLDLGEVVRKDEVVSRSVRDSLVTLIDSLYAQGLKFDIKIDTNIAVENIELREKLASMQKKMEKLNEQIAELPPPVIEEKKEEPEIVKEETVMQSPLSSSQTFIQYTWNIAKNNGTVPTYIYDPKDMNKPLAVVQPGKEQKFNLLDQKEVIVKFGSQQERVKVIPNRKPVIKIERVSTKMSGADIYVQDLQRTTIFNVIISDERPDQLKVSYSGPISVTGPAKDSQGNLVYNVSLKLAVNEARFDEWVDRNENFREADGRYKANFFFTVVDEISKDRVQAGDVFYFTEFSK